MKFIAPAILSLSILAAQSHFILADNQEQKTKTRKLRGGKQHLIVEKKASAPVDAAVESPSQRLLDEEQELMGFDEASANFDEDEEDADAAALEYTPETIEYNEGELEAMYGPDDEEEEDDEELAMEYSNEEVMMMGLFDTKEASEYDTYGEETFEYSPETVEYDERELEAMYGPDEDEELAMEYGGEAIMGLDAEETPEYDEGELEAMYGPDEDEELAMEYGSESIMGLDAEETPEYDGGEFEAMYGPDEDEGLEMELEEEMMMGLDSQGGSEYDTYREDASEYTPETIEYDEGELAAMYGPDEDEDLEMELEEEILMGLDTEEEEIEDSSSEDSPDDAM